MAEGMIQLHHVSFAWNQVARNGAMLTAELIDTATSEVLQTVSMLQGPGSASHRYNLQFATVTPPDRLRLDYSIVHPLWTRAGSVSPVDAPVTRVIRADRAALFP